MLWRACSLVERSEDRWKIRRDQTGGDQPQPWKDPAAESAVGLRLKRNEITALKRKPFNDGFFSSPDQVLLNPIPAIGGFLVMQIDC